MFYSTKCSMQTLLQCHPKQNYTIISPFTQIVFKRHTLLRIVLLEWYLCAFKIKFKTMLLDLSDRIYPGDSVRNIYCCC